MKVFISHKKEDEAIALRVHLQLKSLNVESYLDLLDPSVAGNGKALTEHIRSALNSCSDILVVMSENTKYSQWVPFEIGMAAESYMPTVTYLSQDVMLPEFLSFWPRLRKPEDLAAYVSAKQYANAVIDIRARNFRYSTIEKRKADTMMVFYDELKRRLTR